MYGEDGIFGSGTVFQADDPLYIPKSMQKGGPLYRKGLERVQLIAGRFGGSGQDIRNLAAIHGDVNRGAMARVEDAAAEHIYSGHTVFYQVMAHCPSATDPMPDRFDITWSSSSGASDSVPVHNTP